MYWVEQGGALEEIDVDVEVGVEVEVEEPQKVAQEKTDVGSGVVRRDLNKYLAK